jgi:hypothetical protein
MSSRSERGWVRGAVVIGLAATMMAVALLSPALAVRLATTSYVKAKVNGAINSFRNQATNSFVEDGLTYVRSGLFPIGAGNFQVISVGCPAGQHVTGGGASTPNILTTDNPELEFSYPSNGATPGAGTTGWTVSVENFGSDPFNASAYAICARSSGFANYIEGSSPRVTTTAGRH